jgi:hypothetical protein
VKYYIIKRMCISFLQNLGPLLSSAQGSPIFGDGKEIFVDSRTTDEEDVPSFPQSRNYRYYIGKGKYETSIWHTLWLA